MGNSCFFLGSYDSSCDPSGSLLVTELGLSLTVFLRVMAVGVFATLYSIGGRSDKWIRRYLGAITFSAILIGLSLWFGSFNWWFAAIQPLAIYVLSRGYSTTVKRIGYGIVFGIFGLLCGLSLGDWFLGAVQFLIAVFANIVFGLYNPVKAPLEEGLISGLSVFIIPFML